MWDDMPSSPTLSAAEVASHARSAGFPSSQISTAVAVARAESGFNPRAHNPVGLDNSYGLWQINMRGALGPDRRRALSIASNEALYDPATNARAALMIWKRAGNSWQPWTTFTSGRHKQYLSTAPGSGRGLDPEFVREAVENAHDKAGFDPTGLGRRLDTLTETFRRQSWNWLILLVALVLLTLGFVVLNRSRVKKIATLATRVAAK